MTARDGRPSSCPASPGSSGRSPPGCARSARASSRIARSASIRSCRVSPIPIRIPVVNGIRSSPARRSVSRRTNGRLSGDPKWGPPRSERRSEIVSSMIPCETDTPRSSSSSAPSSRRGSACGQQPGLGEDELGHARQVLDRRLASELGELLAGDPVAPLGLVAEREQRLVAARLRACPARSRAPRRQSGTRARHGAAASQTCSSGRRRGRASSGG